jgi:hypothetical protein
MIKMTKDIRRTVTDDFGLEEGVVKIIQVHADVVDRDYQSEQGQHHRQSELVGYCCFDTLLLAVPQAVGRNVVFLMVGILYMRHIRFLIYVFQYPPFIIMTTHLKPKY